MNLPSLSSAPSPEPATASDRPEVTVIVPVYKGGTRVDTVIRSLLNQTYRPLRILVINDGSPLPEDALIGERFGNRIDFVQQPNAGLCATWNRAVAMTTSPLIARLDQDDESLPERIEEQVKLLQTSGADVCLSAIYKVTDNARVMAVHPVGLEAPVAFDPNLRGAIVLSTLLARTEFVKRLEGNDPALYPCDDFDWLIRAWRAGRVVIHPRPLVRYLLHDGANTFKYFWQMELKTKYLIEDMKLPERRIGFAEWQALPDGRGRLGVREKALSLGKLFYRMAGIRIGLRRYITGFGLLLVSALLNPRFFYYRIGSSLHLMRRLDTRPPTHFASTQPP